MKYLGERGEIDGTRLAVVGHDMSGPIALKLAAADPRVKSVALVAVPGRPYWSTCWPASSRPSAGRPRPTPSGPSWPSSRRPGSFPPRAGIRAEHQTILPVGQDALYKSMFAVDPLADAKAVKVPVMIALGEKSTSVFQDDADALQRRPGRHQRGRRGPQRHRHPADAEGPAARARRAATRAT